MMLRDSTIGWKNCFADNQAEQDWLRRLKANAFNTFETTGLPSRRDEQWKYTDPGFLANKTFASPVMAQEKKVEAIAATHSLSTESIFIVLINGYYSQLLSQQSHLPAGAVLSSLRAAFISHPDLVKSYLIKQTLSPFLNLNTALLTDGVFLYLPKDIRVTVPIHFLYINTDQHNFVSSPRNLIILEAGAEATILEEHVSQQAENYFTNLVTDISVAENGRLYYHKIQNENEQAAHIAQTFVQQKKDSVVKMCTLTVGGGFAREDIFVDLKEPGADTSVNGFYVLNNNDQHIDNHIQIDHTAPHGSSDLMYKGVLDNKSHAVFNGKIKVHPEAQKTRSQQANHNLLLSPTAAIDTKPELEIYADDVKCSHGNTVGQLDADSLFYLRSRGIDRQAALKMLTHAFADDVMNRITHPAIMRRMLVLLNEKLDYDN